MSFCLAAARGSARCQKWARRKGFVASGVGHFWTGSGKVYFAWQAQYKRHVHQIHQRCWSGRWFLERGCILDHQIFRFAKMIFAPQVRHFVWLGITFSWQGQCCRQMEWKNRKTNCHEAVGFAFNCPFLKEISPNCFGFALVNFDNWGSLAEFPRFWRCQGQKWGSLAELLRFWCCQA